MAHSFMLRSLVCVATLLCLGTTSTAQNREETTVEDAASVLTSAVSSPLNRIPRSMLNDAKGIVIVPDVIKGGFVIGARHGNGVALVRDQNNNWSAPVFVSLTGGNVGWQVGIQSSDVVLVFKSAKSVEQMLNGEFTIGVDAAAAAGPIGRQASAGTDGRLSAEVYSYSKSRGLFVGASIDGSVIKLDRIANATYYRSPGPNQPVVVPDSGIRLAHLVTALSATDVVDSQPTALDTANQTQTGFAPSEQHSTDETLVVKQQLATIAPELYELLDQQWQEYLALPVEVFHGAEHPQLQVLQNCLNRFDEVVISGRYENLVTRPEFQSTHSLLKHYVGALSYDDSKLDLPPPPTVR